MNFIICMLSCHTLQFCYSQQGMTNLYGSSYPFKCFTCHPISIFKFIIYTNMMTMLSNSCLLKKIKIMKILLVLEMKGRMKVRHKKKKYRLIISYFNKQLRLFPFQFYNSKMKDSNPKKDT